MSRKYSVDQLRSNLSKALSEPESLYQKSFVNWKGCIQNSGEFYTEIISKELLHQEIDIKRIVRKRKYLSVNTRSIHSGSSNRLEERFAKLLHRENLDGLGEVFDYQIPLKDVQSRNAGKIDLVTKTNENIFLVELKGPLNRKDTLLRSVLEAWTYSKQIGPGFLQECKEKIIKSEQIIEPEDIKPAVLLFPGTLAYDETKEIQRGDRPQLSALVKRLNVLIFTFNPSIINIK